MLKKKHWFWCNEFPFGRPLLCGNLGSMPVSCNHNLQKAFRIFDIRITVLRVCIERWWFTHFCDISPTQSSNSSVGKPKSISDSSSPVPTSSSESDVTSFASGEMSPCVPIAVNINHLFIVRRVLLASLIMMESKSIRTRKLSGW